MENLDENFFQEAYLWLDMLLRQNGVEVLGWPLLLFLVLAGFSVFILRSRLKGLDLDVSRLQAELKDANNQLEIKNNELSRVQERLHQQEIELSRVNAEFLAQTNSSGQRILELKASLTKSEEYLEKKSEDLQSLQASYTRLKTTLEEKESQFTDQLALLNNAKTEMKKDFELLANEILDAKGKAFKELNQQSIQNLLTPVQVEMKGFREKVETLHTEETKQRSELKNELLNLQKLNREITDQAEQLTTALKGQKKVQGNWGELILENVLDNSGLRLGKDYQREVSFKTEDGRKRPDAIVYMPQNKHLVIDAKTSLAAYTRYVNAENELESSTALAEHAAAIKDRIEELSDRDYYNLPGLNSPEVVIMFIPIESAYVEALKHDESLYQRAIEKHVLVATPTTLLTSLNIVRQLWQFEDRNKHTAELAERAGKFYNKLNGFLSSMQKVGDQIDSARQTYDTAMKQLYSGKGNLIKQASEFKDLGVSVQKELPAELLDKASLELEVASSDNEDDRG